MVRSERRHIGFEISVSGRDDGTLEALYIHLQAGEVAETREIEPDVLLADYDAAGRLLGIEILAPVQISALEALVEQQQREPFRRFISRNAPHELVSN